MEHSSTVPARGKWQFWPTTRQQHSAAAANQAAGTTVAMPPARSKRRFHSVRDSEFEIYEENETDLNRYVMTLVKRHLLLLVYIFH